jgi:hypothetical protein
LKSVRGRIQMERCFVVSRCGTSACVRRTLTLTGKAMGKSWGIRTVSGCPEPSQRSRHSARSHTQVQYKISQISLHCFGLCLFRIILLSPSLSPCRIIFLSLALSRSLSLSFSHFVLSHSLPLSFTLSNSLSLSCSLNRSLSYTQTMNMSL